MDPRLIGNWSFRMARMFGTEVRIHWTLLAITAIESAAALQNGMSWWYLPVLVVVPFVSVLVHEFGHVTAARLIGGEADRIVMWMCGGLAYCSYPLSPGRMFFVTAAGPLVSLLLCVAGLAPVLLFRQDQHIGYGLLPAYGLTGLGDTGDLLLFFGRHNLYLLIFNLLPCHPMDGGRLMRAVLWPLIGLRRAIITTIIVGYVCSLGLVTFGVLVHEMMLVVIAIFLLISLVAEHRAYRAGLDPQLGEVHDGDTSWWTRRGRARSLAVLAQRQAEAEAEQATLDRLLAKVTEQGLPALTKAEREQLQAISRRRRETAAS